MKPRIYLAGRNADLFIMQIWKKPLTIMADTDSTNIDG